VAEGKPHLDADAWRRVFRRVSETLPRDRVWRVMVIGGVAMALGYGARRTTTDADVVSPPLEVLIASRAVAAEFGLPSDWMNQNAELAGFISSSVAIGGSVVFETDSLVIEAPSAEHMLAMKVARLAGDTDRDDARILLSKLAGFTDVEDVWAHIGGLVPLAQRAQARHNLHVLWESGHESQ
jgi:hypothetical protein